MVNRQEDAAQVASLIEQLLQFGVLVVVITGTSFDNIDRQFARHVRGPHKRCLYICTNRGSEVYSFDREGHRVLLYRRQSTPEEEHLLTEIADAVRDEVAARSGLNIEIIYDRLNRRKIDLIPLPEWRDPPKSVIRELLAATQRRLKDAGIAGGIGEVFELTQRIAREKGLPEARITSDVKHIEVGLTDKGDAVAWVMQELAARAKVPAQDILIAGDEFGPISGFDGSDHRMVAPAQGAVFVSVGVEPNGTPPDVIHLGGGPLQFQGLLAQQVSLHQKEALSFPTGPLQIRPTPDPSWVLVEEGVDPAREREIESLFAVSNGYLGTRGSVAEGSVPSSPATFVAGVYDAVAKSNANPEIVVAPDWASLHILADGEELNLTYGTVLEHRRILDMRQGILFRTWRHQDPAGRITLLDFLRFVSLDDRHAMAESVMVVPENYAGAVQVRSLLDGRVTNAGNVVHLELVEAAPKPSDSLLVVRTLDSGVILAFASLGELEGTRGELLKRSKLVGPQWVGEDWRWDAEVGHPYKFSKLATVYTSRETSQPQQEAVTHLSVLACRKLDSLLDAHVSAWAKRWRAANIELVGDEAMRRVLRFAMYHLISAVNPEDPRVSVGARALTGEAYDGHVFWDTETFMLPFYILTYPEAARALLMYRYYTLPAAREKARILGYRGALWAWESADTGEETTPTFALTPQGEVIQILSGNCEHHITADVAYGAWQYWRATGDEPFLLEAGAELILEAARFWASRAQKGADGRYHIPQAMGPDEYHENVDDNAYTIGMARWNLEKGAELASYLEKRWPERWASLSKRLGLDREEVDEWLTVARGLVSCLDEASGLMEQFKGYFNLKYIDPAAYEPRVAPLDVVLGRAVVQESQIIKQADVVMLLYLLWDQFPPEVREENFRFYEARCGHGSSLSPAVHALVAARLGDIPLAERYLEQAAEIDLANNMGNASGGVHMGALGGLWQAVVFGFGGLMLRDDGLALDPHLPSMWDRLRFPLQWRGSWVEVVVSREPLVVEVTVTGESPVAMAVGDRVSTVLQPGNRYHARWNGGWSDWEVAA